MRAHSHLRMHLRTHTLVALGAFVAVAAALPAQSRGVGMIERSGERRTMRSDSLADRVLTGDVESVKRTVAAWRERETQLLREIRALPEGDIAARRRLEESLALHTRDGFAIMSAIQARCIDEGGPRPAGYLGLNLTNIFQVENGQPKGLGTTVTSVEPGSPAERAGIARNDKVLALAGLDATERTPDISAQLVPGRTIAVRIERAGAPRELSLTVARRPEGFGDSCGEFERALVPMRIPGPGRIIVDEPGSGNRRVIVESRELPDRRDPESEMRIVVFGPGSERMSAVAFFAGAEFKMLDADWGEVLGVRQGVIVSDVANGSAAALSGLKSGDVITAVGRSPVASPMILVQMLGTMEQREATLNVVRARDRRTITLKWGAR